MRKILLSAFCFIALTATPLHAQLSITVGNGTSAGTYAPVASWYESSATESIYKGTEIGATGQITKIAYQKASGASTTEPNVKIYMKTSVVNSLSADYSIGQAFNDYTLVYEGTLPNNGTGWMEVSLQTPFNYNDTSKSLSILVTGSTCIDSGRPQYTYTTTSGNKMSAGYNDGTIGCGGNNPWTADAAMGPVWERPNIRLAINGALSLEDFEQNKTVKVYGSNGVLTVASVGSTLKNISIFDLNGRLLYNSNTINDKELRIDTVKAGNQMLIVKVTDAEDRTFNKKIVF